MSLQGNRNKRGQSSAMLREKKKEEKEKEYLSTFSDKYHKDMKKRQKRDSKKQTSSRRTKELTPAQKRFKEREAKGLSGLTGGKKGETLAESRARRKKAMQDAAKERNKKFKEARKNKDKLKTNTSKRKSRYNNPNKR